LVCHFVEKNIFPSRTFIFDSGLFHRFEFVIFDSDENQCLDHNTDNFCNVIHLSLTGGIFSWVSPAANEEVDGLPTMLSNHFSLSLTLQKNRLHSQNNLKTSKGW
jgi:hypothetical protein